MHRFLDGEPDIPLGGTHRKAFEQMLAWKDGLLGPYVDRYTTGPASKQQKVEDPVEIRIIGMEHFRQEHPDLMRGARNL